MPSSMGPVGRQLDEATECSTNVCFGSASLSEAPPEGAAQRAERLGADTGGRSRRDRKKAWQLSGVAESLDDSRRRSSLRSPCAGVDPEFGLALKAPRSASVRYATSDRPALSACYVHCTLIRPSAWE